MLNASGRQAVLAQTSGQGIRQDIDPRYQAKASSLGIEPEPHFKASGQDSEPRHQSKTSSLDIEPRPHFKASSQDIEPKHQSKTSAQDMISRCRVRA